MWIGVDVLLDSECLALGFEHYAQVYVQSRGIRSKGRVIGILDIPSGPFRIIGRHVRGGIFRVHILKPEETSLTVHLGIEVSICITHHNGRHTCCLSHPVVVRTEGRSNVHNTRSALLDCHIVARDDLECALPFRLEPRDELMIFDADEFAALDFAVKNGVGHELVARFVVFERKLRRLGIEPGTHKRLCQHIDSRGSGVRIEGFHPHVVYVRAHTESSVGRQGPRSCGPGEEIYRQSLTAEKFLGLFVLDEFELHCCGGVLDVPVAARLVEFVGTQARSGSRGIRLDGETLVEQALVIDILEQIPESLDIAVVVGDIGIVGVHPIADSVGQ